MAACRCLSLPCLPASVDSACRHLACSLRPARMEQTTAAAGALMASVASAAAPAASPIPPRVSFEFPTNAEQTEYDIITIKGSRLNGTTQEAWSNSLVWQAASASGRLGEAWAEDSGGDAAPSFRVSLCQRTDASRRRVLNTLEPFAEEWEPSEGPVCLYFTRVTARQSTAATHVRIPTPTETPQIIFGTPAHAAAIPAPTATAAVAAAAATEASNVSALAPIPAHTPTPTQRKKRGATTPPEPPSASSAVCEAPMHDDDFERDLGGGGWLEDNQQQEEGKEEEERKEGCSHAARRLDLGGGSNIPSAADGPEPHNGKRQRVQPIFHRQMRLQPNATLGRVLLLGHADLDLAESLPAGVVIGTPLRMRRWQGRGVQFEMCAAAAGAAAHSTSAAAASSRPSPPPARTVAVAREHYLPKQLLGPCRLPAGAVPTPTDWGALVHSLLFSQHPPILQSEARVHADRTIRISLFLAEKQILSCLPTDEEQQQRPQSPPRPPSVDLLALEAMHSEEINSRIAMLMYQLVDNDACAARVRPLLEHVRRIKNVPLAERQLNYEQLARLEGHIMSAATVTLPNPLPPLLVGSQTSAQRANGETIALHPHQVHGASHLAACAVPVDPAASASSSVAVPGQIRLFEVLDESSGRMRPLFHGFLSGYSSVGGEVMLPLELVQARQMVWNSPGSGKTLLILKFIRELRLRNRRAHPPRPNGPSLLVTRDTLIPQWAEQPLKFMSPCRVAILVSPNNSRVSRLAIDVDVRRLTATYCQPRFDGAATSCIRVISSLEEVRAGDFEICIADWTSLRVCTNKDSEGEREDDPLCLYNALVTDEGQLLKTVNNRKQLVAALKSLADRAQVSVAVTGTPLNRGRLDDLMFLFNSLQVPLFGNEKWLHRFVLLPLSLDPLGDSYGCRQALLAAVSHLAIKHDDRDIPFPPMDERDVAVGVPTALEQAVNRLLVQSGADSHTRRLAACHPAFGLWPRKAAAIAGLPPHLFAQAEAPAASVSSTLPAAASIFFKAPATASVFSSSFGRPSVPSDPAQLAKAQALLGQLSDMAALLQEATRRVQVELKSALFKMADKHFQWADAESEPRRVLQNYNRVNEVLEQLDLELQPDQRIRYLKGSGAALRAPNAGAADSHAEAAARFDLAGEELDRFLQSLPCLADLQQQCDDATQRFQRMKDVRRPHAYSDADAARAVASDSWWMPDPMREAKTAMWFLHAPETATQVANVMGENGGNQCSRDLADLHALLLYASQLVESIRQHRWRADGADVGSMAGNQPCHTDQGYGAWEPRQMDDEREHIMRAVKQGDATFESAARPAASAAASSSGSGGVAGHGSVSVPFLSRCCVCRLISVCQQLRTLFRLHVDDHALSRSVVAGHHIFPLLLMNAHRELFSLCERLLKAELHLRDCELAQKARDESLGVLSYFDLAQAAMACVDAHAAPPPDGLVRFFPGASRERLERLTDNVDRTHFFVRVRTPLAALSADDLARMRQLHDVSVRAYECDDARDKLEELFEPTHVKLLAVRQAAISHIRRTAKLFQAITPSAAARVYANSDSPNQESQAKRESRSAAYEAQVRVWHTHARDLERELKRVQVESAGDGNGASAATSSSAAAAAAAAPASTRLFSSRKFMDIRDALLELQRNWNVQAAPAVKSESSAVSASSASASTRRFRALLISNHRCMLPLLASYLRGCCLSTSLPTSTDSVLEEMTRFQFGSGGGDSGGFRVMVAHADDVGNGIDMPGLHCVGLTDAFTEARNADQAALRARRLEVQHRPVLLRFQTAGTEEQMLSYGSLPPQLLQSQQQQIRGNVELTTAMQPMADEGADEGSVAAAARARAPRKKAVRPRNELDSQHHEQLRRLGEQWGLLPPTDQSAAPHERVQRLLDWCSQADLPQMLLLSPHTRARCVRLCFGPAGALAEPAPSLLPLDQLYALIRQQGLRSRQTPIEDIGLFESVAMLLQEEEEEEQGAAAAAAAAAPASRTALDLSRAVLAELRSPRSRHLVPLLGEGTQLGLESLASGPAPGLAADWVCVQLLAVHLSCDIVLLTDDAAHRLPVIISPLWRDERLRAAQRPPLYLAHWQLERFAPLSRQGAQEQAVVPAPAAPPSAPAPASSSAGPPVLAPIPPDEPVAMSIDEPGNA